MRRDEFPIVHMAIKDAVVKALEDVRAEIDKHKLPCCFKDDRGYTHFLPNVIKVDDVLEIIDRKIAEVSGKDCRDCKKWNACECGKKGHDKGTSIGYSVGECAEYEVKGDKE